MNPGPSAYAAMNSRGRDGRPPFNHHQQAVDDNLERDNDRTVDDLHKRLGTLKSVGRRAPVAPSTRTTH